MSLRRDSSKRATHACPRNASSIAATPNIVARLVGELRALAFEMSSARRPRDEILIEYPNFRRESGRTTYHSSERKFYIGNEALVETRKTRSNAYPESRVLTTAARITMTTSNAASATAPAAKILSKHATLFSMYLSFSSQEKTQ